MTHHDITVPTDLARALLDPDIDQRLAAIRAVHEWAPTGDPGADNQRSAHARGLLTLTLAKPLTDRTNDSGNVELLDNGDSILFWWRELARHAPGPYIDCVTRSLIDHHRKETP